MASELRPPFDDRTRGSASNCCCALCDGLAGPQPHSKALCLTCCLPVVASLVMVACVAVAIALFLLSYVSAQIVAFLAVLGILWFLYFTVRTFKARQSYGAVEAAELLYERRCGRTKNLPEKLKGVFWMSNNFCPELMTTWDSTPFDLEKRVFSVTNGAPRNWTWSSSCCGWIEWLSATLGGPLCCSTNRVTYDANYSKADIHIMICNGRCNLSKPIGCTWTTEDITPADLPPGTTWLRESSMACCPERSRFFYIMRRVIDGSGQRVQPEFDVMIDSLARPGHEGVLIEGLTVKTYVQYVQDGEDAPYHAAPTQEEMRPLAP